MTRRSARRPPFLLLLALLLMPAPSAATAQRAAKPAPKIANVAKAATAARDVVKELWYGVYLADKRAGHMVSQDRRTRWRGQPADLSVTRMRVDLRVLGADTTSDSETQTWATPAGAPLEEISVDRSGGRTSRVRAVYTDRTVTYEADLAGLKKTGKLTLKPGERFWAGDPFAGRRARPAETRLRYKEFNTTTLTLDDADLTIGRRSGASPKEIVGIGGQGVAAFKVPLKIGGVPATAWVDRGDQILRFDLGPLRIVRQPRAVASAPLTARVEVTEIASYRPEGAPLSDPRTLRTARYRIENLSAPLAAIDDDVQTATLTKTPDGNGYVALVTVTTGAPGDLPPLPIAEISRTDYGAFLQPSLYVPSDEAAMRTLARTIVGDEPDARRAAEQLSAWVYKNLTYDAGHSPGLRSASEILKLRRGVCEDYATLVVTLARAAGIPAKHCSGLVYGDDRFYLHAWPEVWVGRWVALEPTWGAPFADATHIKLAEGEPTTQRTGLSRLDAFRIHVLSTGDAASPATPTPTTPATPATETR